MSMKKSDIVLTLLQKGATRKQANAITVIIQDNIRSVITDELGDFMFVIPLDFMVGRVNVRIEAVVEGANAYDPDTMTGILKYQVAEVR